LGRSRIDIHDGIVLFSFSEYPVPMNTDIPGRGTSPKDPPSKELQSTMKPVNGPDSQEIHSKTAKDHVVLPQSIFYIGRYNSALPLKAE